VPVPFILLLGGCIVAAFLLFASVLTINNSNNNIFTLDHVAVAQTQPSPSANFPIHGIEKSPISDKAADAQTPSALQVFSIPSLDGNCEMCQVIKYIPGPLGKAALAYKFAQTLDLTGAKRIVFFAKGEIGGENIAFLGAGKPSNAQIKLPSKIFTNLNFSEISKNVTLTNDWQRYQLSLNGLNLKGVTHPFGFIISKVRGASPQGPSTSAATNPPLIDTNPSHIIFFLKGVTIDNNPALNPLTTVPIQNTSPNTLPAANTTQGASSPVNAAATTKPGTPIQNTSPNTLPAANTTQGASSPVNAAATTKPGTPIQNTSPNTMHWTESPPSKSPNTLPAANTTQGASSPVNAAATTKPGTPIQNTSPNIPTTTTPSSAQSQPQSPYPYAYPYHGSLSPYQSQQPQQQQLQPQQHINQQPIANPGVSQTVYGGIVVTLDGRASYDPDNYVGAGNANNHGIAGYQWIQIPLTYSGAQTPAVITLQGANTPTPTFVAPILPYDTILAFGLRVVDNDGGAVSSNPAIVYVYVKHNPIPNNNNPSIGGGSGGNVPGTIINPQQQQQPLVPNNNNNFVPAAPSQPTSSRPQPQIGSPNTIFPSGR
jgi:hypothetical protein